MLQVTPKRSISLGILSDVLSKGRLSVIIWIWEKGGYVLVAFEILQSEMDNFVGREMFDEDLTDWRCIKVLVRELDSDVRVTTVLFSSEV